MLIFTSCNKAVNTGYAPLTGIEISAVILFPDDFSDPDRLIEHLINCVFTRMCDCKDQKLLEASLLDVLHKYQSHDQQASALP